MTAVFALCLWGYHATSKNGFDRPARIGINLVHGNLLIGLVFWAVLASCRARELTAVRCWG